MTIREMASEWANAGRMKPSTRRRVDSAVRLYLTSTALAAMDVGAVTRRDCERWFAGIPAPGAANRTLDVLRRVLSEAVARGMRSDNPAAGMRTHPRRLVTRFLSRPELRRVQRALDAAVARSRGAADAQVDAIRMLLYTGARCGEIIGLRWAEVRQRSIHLQDSKTGPRVVPLSAPARGILERRRARRRDEVFVFERSRRPISAELSVWRRVRREADVADVRLHDLRHYSGIRIIPSRLQVDGGRARSFNVLRGTMVFDVPE